jgi:hypothetical protein
LKRGGKKEKEKSKRPFSIKWAQFLGDVTIFFGVFGDVTS